jgi:hypothetical protein
MRRDEIAPALKPEEWQYRESGALAVHGVGDEVHVVIHDPDDQLVTVSGPHELFALIALANDALPVMDMRKVTPRIVELMRRAIVVDAESGRSISPDAIGTGELHAFAAVLEALLPPVQR